MTDWEARCRRLEAENEKLRMDLGVWEMSEGEGREIQGEHLRDWEKAGIPLRCCFWCTLNDVTARVTREAPAVPAPDEKEEAEDGG